MSWIIFLILLAVVIMLVLIFKNPYKYPYQVIEFDVTGKREPKAEDYLDDYLIKYGFNQINIYNNSIIAWKNETQQAINGMNILKEYRQNQFYSIIDDNNAFVFRFYRMQTRYRQVNYQRTAYKVKNEISEFRVNYNYLLHRDMQLRNIGYETTLSAYNSKEQRKMMTSRLRKQIAIRDNFTCRRCGKFMPDYVGLQIDHIIPISKGGKTVPSNLQVLCSKCNLSKSNKTK